MLIPSIDLMGGKIVQLVQGEKKALEFDDFDEWIARFSTFPLVQLIDLDAAIGGGDNRALLRQFTERLPCQVGGGIRSLEGAEQILSLGAKHVILGSVLIKDAQIDTHSARRFAEKFGPDRPRQHLFDHLVGAGESGRVLRSRNCFRSARPRTF